MISINNLDFHYTKKKPLFKGLNLELKRGKIYGLLGKNGAGKSTLLKLICGSLKPKGGIVQINNLESFKRNNALLEEVYLLQEESFLPPISLKQYVDAYKEFYPRFDSEKLKACMEVFDVSLSAKPTEISFGQRKKFFLSFGMATNVDYLILDEPTNSLDIPSRSQFRKALTSGFSETQCIIVSTHNLFDFSHLFDNIIVVDDGQVIFHQDIADIEKRLQFVPTNAIDDNSSIIYSDTRYGEGISVLPNSEANDNSADIEVLFKAVIKDSKSINSCFKN